MSNSQEPIFKVGMDKVECILCGWEKWTGNNSKQEILFDHNNTCLGFRIIMVKRSPNV